MQDIYIYVYIYIYFLVDDFVVSPPIGTCNFLLYIRQFVATQHDASTMPTKDDLPESIVQTDLQVSWASASWGLMSNGRVEKSQGLKSLTKTDMHPTSATAKKRLQTTLHFGSLFDDNFFGGVCCGIGYLIWFSFPKKTLYFSLRTDLRVYLNPVLGWSTVSGGKPETVVGLCEPKKTLQSASHSFMAGGFQGVIEVLSWKTFSRCWHPCHLWKPIEERTSLSDMMGLQSFGSLDHVWEDSVGRSPFVNPNFITDDRKDQTTRPRLGKPNFILFPSGQIIATENTT